MKVFDLHCDTLTKCFDERISFNKKGKTHISLDNSTLFDKWVQCYAVFIDDIYKGESATQYFKRVAHHFKEVVLNDINIKKVDGIFDIDNDNQVCKAILTVENGSMLGGNIENIKLLEDFDVKLFSLTWNGANEIAGGVLSEQGLTDFGKKVISELEERNIVLDVSHLNDKSFYEFCDNVKKPFIASHSNARSICHMLRNLKDDQLKIIFACGGVVGINFYPKFIERMGSNDYFDDVYAHIYHMLSLGGEYSVALGSDFDGAEMGDKMPNQEYLFRLYEYLLSRNINEETINNIYYNNAYNFFKKVL